MTKLVVYLTIISFFLFPQEVKASQNTQDDGGVYEKLRLTFKYGTKTEILRGLSLYNERNLKEGAKERYFKSLQELMELQILDYDINYQVFNILRNNAQNAEDYYRRLFEKIIKEDGVAGDKLRLYLMLLDAMVNSKNKGFSSEFKKIYLDEGSALKDKGLRTDGALIRVVRAYREFGEDIPTADLESLYKSSSNGELKGEIVRSIAAKKNLGDLPFLKEQLEASDVDRVVKGIILVELSNYGADPEVMTTLSKYSNNSDDALKARAIYAMSQLGDATKKLSMFEEGIRSSSDPIRLQALEIAKSIMSEEVKKVLEYKKESDPSAAVRKKAKEILDGEGNK